MDRRLAHVGYHGWEPPSDLPLLERVRREVKLGGGYGKSGPLDLRQSPWLVPPLEAMMDHRIQKVNCLKGLQTGGSLVGEAAMLLRIKEDPCPMVMNFQTEAIRNKVWRIRLNELLSISPATRDVMPKDRHSLAYGIVSFPGCDLTIQGGGHNESNIQTISWQFIINDEVWQWEPGMLYQAEGRADAFGAARKIYNVSQGNHQESDWDEVFHEGIVHEFVVRCPSCGDWHPLVWTHRLDDGSWGGVVWENQKYLDGRPNVAHAQATVRYRCPLCGFYHERGDVAMRKLVAGGKYSTEWPQAAYHAMELPARVVGKPNGVPYIQSFHWNSLVSVSLDKLVSEWLTADYLHSLGNFTKKREFMQKKLSVFYSESMTETVVELNTGGYQMGDSYPAETDRIMAVDCQEGVGNDTPHFWVAIRAWVRGVGDSGLIWAGRLETEADLIEKQLELGVVAKFVVVDGRNKTAEVAAMCQRNGWLMLLGDDKVDFPHSVGKGRKRKIVRRVYSELKNYDVMKGRGVARYCKFLLWSNPTIKDMVWSLRSGKGVRFEAPVDVPEWYQDQFDSERRVKTRKGHQWVPKKKSNPNNHIWDCECMGVVRAIVADLLPFELMAPVDEVEENKKMKKAEKSLKENEQLELVVSET